MNNNNQLRKLINNNSISNNNVSSYKFIEYIFIFVLIIICLIIIIIIIIRGINKNKNMNKINPMIIEVVKKAYNNKEKLIYEIPNGIDNGQYSISMWLYIEDYNYNLNKDKVIISDNYNDINYNLVYLSKTFNNLVFNLKIFDLKNNTLDKKCVLENIPIQKWINVILILKNRTAEIYLDGRLSKVCYLEYVPVPLNKLKILNNDLTRSGFYGRISKLQFFNTNLGFNKIQDIFQNGLR